MTRASRTSTVVSEHSPLVSNVVKKQRAGVSALTRKQNNDKDERANNRKYLLDEKKRRQSLFLSPSTVAEDSPKAQPSTKIASAFTSGLFGNDPAAAALFSTDRKDSPLRTVDSAHPRQSFLVKDLGTSDLSSASFEEWIKITANNKINAKNSWSIKLIDHFSDMSVFLEHGSINFQKASIALDGCMKIYSTRVDFVAEETDKLRSGLWEEKSAEPDALLEGQEAAPRTKTRFKSAAPSATLERNPENLNLKKSEVFQSFAGVDPFLKRVCQRSDEFANQRAFLINSLPLSFEGQLLFDCSEHRLFPTAAELGTPAGEKVRSPPLSLSSYCFPSSSQMSRPIQPSLSDIGPFSPHDFDFDRLPEKINLLVTLLSASGSQCESALAVDYDASTEDASNQPFDNFQPFSEQSANTAEPEECDAFGANESDPEDISIRPAIAAQDDYLHQSLLQLTLADHESTGSLLQPIEQSSQLMGGGWAGPSHWRIKRPVVAQRCASKPSAPRPPRRQQSFLIDFASAQFISDPIAAIPKASSTAAITIEPIVMKERSQFKHLLPLDHRFSSRDLLRLFTKPDFDLSAEAVSVGCSSAEPVIEEFLADVEQPPPAEVIRLSSRFQHGIHKALIEDSASQLPSANSEDEVPTLGDDAPFYAPAESESATPIPHLSSLRYTHVAKRVDMHRLKEAVWHEVTQHRLAQSPTPVDARLQSLIQDRCSRDPQIADATASLVFICLLHLANELGNFELVNGDGLLFIKWF